MRIKKSKGSVGRYMPIPPNSIFSRFKERGVKKTINQNVFSRETRLTKNKTMAAGIRLSQKKSK